MRNRTLNVLTGLFLLLAAALPAVAKDQPELAPGLYARMVTERGEMLFELDYNRLPLTVSNFVALAEGKMNVGDQKGARYYTDLPFFRVVPGYAVFSGDPAGTGLNGVDYTVPRESGSLYSTGTPGALAMVSRQGEDHGSQFMIMIGGDPFLDQKYTPFGRMISGQKVLKKIKLNDRLETVEILRIGPDAETFRPEGADVTAMISTAREKARKLFIQEYPDVAEVLDSLGDGVVRSETGIFYKIHKEGDGARPRPGSKVRMHYSGRLLNGQEFDNSYVRGEPFQFTLGKDGVIPGWVETALSMQPGERRTILLPPELAYGENGYGPIPPASWLVFEIELIDFQ